MTNTSHKIPVVVLGGTGYVAGELLRLLAVHPHYELCAAVSESQAGATIQAVFPHLHSAFGKQEYISRAALGATLQNVATTSNVKQLGVFSAAPHGASAPMIAEVLAAAEGAGFDTTVVDASADFRYATADAYAAVYDHAHGAPELLDQFACALPEHSENPTQPHIGHPGCYATAMLLGAVPLLKLGLVDAPIAAFGITGSTGSGRAPLATTHHPLRHANVYAYKPLAHRHAPEVMDICAAVSGTRPDLRFIPHSGPFARGIHMTLQTTLAQSITETELRAALQDFYSDAEFVEVVAGTPRIKDVVGSNYAQVGVAVNGSAVAVFIVIDNLLKGAAGGCVQWMNIKLGLDPTAGLLAAGPGWV